MDTKKNPDESGAPAFVSGPIPPQTKRVRATKVEIYDEPIQPEPPDNSESDSQAAAEVEFGECRLCTGKVLSTEDFENDPVEGLAHKDCIANEQAESQPSVPQSPADRFLSSLKTDEIRGNQLRIYVYREPDPVGAAFRNPYSGPRKTVGPLAYDPSFDSAAAVEAYVQRLHHGGSYYFEVREGGKYATSWSQLIDDPQVAAKVAPENGAAAGATSSAAPATVVDPLDHLVATSGKLKQIRDAMGWGRDPRPVDNATTVTNPVDQLASSVAMVTSVMDLAKQLRPEPAATTAPGEKSTAGEVLDYVRELGIAEVIRDGMKHIGLPLLAQYIQNRNRRGNVGAPTPNAQPQVAPQSGTGVLDSPAGSGGASPGGAPGAPVPVNSTALPQEAIDLVLRPLVSEMMADVAAGAGQDDYTYNVASSVESLENLVRISSDAEAFIKAEVLPKSGVQLLVWLGEANPEWKLLQSTSDATDYAGWLNDLRLELRDALMSAADSSSEVSTDVARETSSPDNGGVEILDITIGKPPDTGSAAGVRGDVSARGTFNSEVDSRGETSPQGQEVAALETAPAADVSRGTSAGEDARAPSAQRAGKGAGKGKAK